MEMCLKTFNAEIARIPTIFKPLFEKHERAVRLKINKVSVKIGHFISEMVNSDFKNEQKSGLFPGQNYNFRFKICSISTKITFLGSDGHLLELAHPAALFRWHQ